MSTYTYQCRCGHEFEDFQKMPGKSSMKCPECGQRAKKIIKPTGLIFKGRGFHCNDYPKGK
ncbi:MAG TPA: zinc ribbon domain-containing protein [bacterium]|nr:zinc ribbon domain-containing protein [bacterium]